MGYTLSMNNVSLSVSIFHCRHASSYDACPALFICEGISPPLEKVANASKCNIRGDSKDQLCKESFSNPSLPEVLHRCRRADLPFPKGGENTRCKNAFVYL